MDNFYEQLETTEKTTNYKFLNVVMYIFGVLFFLAMFMGLLIPCVVFAALGVGAFFLKKKAYVEYEYDFTNGEIDIDVIYEMKKRKRLLTFDIKDIELLAEEKSLYVMDFSNKPEKEMSCYPKTSDKKVYVAMVTGGTERVQLRFTPNKELIDLCFRYNPRAIKRN